LSYIIGAIRKSDCRWYDQDIMFINHQKLGLVKAQEMFRETTSLKMMSAMHNGPGAKMAKPGLHVAEVKSGKAHGKASAEKSEQSGKGSGKAATTYHPSKRACYRCGSEKHSHLECRFKDQTCRKCGKKGHVANRCDSIAAYRERKSKAGNANAALNESAKLHEEERVVDVESLFQRKVKDGKP